MTALGGSLASSTLRPNPQLGQMIFMTDALSSWEKADTFSCLD
jgi:hypothetical protein